MTLSDADAVQPGLDLEWTTKALQTLTQLHGVVHGVVLTSDGMIKGASSGLSRASAEGAAAVTSGLQSCARQVAGALSGHADTALRQVVVETGDGFVFSVPAGAHTHLVLYTTREADLGMVSYEVHRHIGNLGSRVLNTPARDTLG
ncbi:roadblock/LC7 domain-containing protein [Streptacidiphilus sp. PB12-B1b]|uniref:roadblock/LC7 domain-containing protein n=1 Tax=Streptacidiphilus sp. PB12-B1b TaxID=2705012 RepID=UPI0015FC4CC3|nr:roadblock/LC7 domain-containing protein [Streptacidiphilus sp. PB12-B1b]QMU77712.1 roadblock/LC7 domain-containing protein [Streptacidiphilus sp. PB12-B1b]